MIQYPMSFEAHKALESVGFGSPCDHLTALDWLEETHGYQWRRHAVSPRSTGKFGGGKRWGARTFESGQEDFIGDFDSPDELIIAICKRVGEVG